MLNRPTNWPRPGAGREFDAVQEHGDEGVIDVDQLIAAARRQLWVVVVCAILGLALGVAYLATAEPLYTASSQILLDDRQVRAVQDVSAMTDGVYDSGRIDSQVEVVMSKGVAEAVVDKLDLVNDEQFMRSEVSLIGGIRNAIMSALEFGGSAPPPRAAQDPETAKKESAIYRLRRDLNVARVARTYVLDVYYTSPDPQDAARIVNAVVASYIDDQLNAKYAATRRAGEWLESRIQELKERSLASDYAVQKYRAENNLITADGRLVGEQQLTELNSQLMVARSEAVQAEARFERIDEIIDSGQMDAAVTESLESDVIGKLRENLLEASKRYSEISQSLGENHDQAVKYKNEMEQYQRSIFSELGRIAESYRSSFEIAKSRERAVSAQLERLVGRSASANEILVGLRELEREAETYRNLYQSFLQRYQETVQQQSFPNADARVIANAAVPTSPAYPKKALALALALVLGGAGGVAVAALREFRDRGVRTGGHVRDELGLPYLGWLPRVRNGSITRPPTPPVEPTLANRTIRLDQRILREVLDNPFSGFAEALRTAKFDADQQLSGSASKVIGVVSAFPGEGKSTVSKNFASLLASLGARTLLVDCDLRNPDLSRSLAANAEAGLLEMLTEGRPLHTLLLVEPESRLFTLPAVCARPLSHTSELLASPAMGRAFATARDVFDYIVVDLPPLAPIVDVRAIAHQIDGFLFIVEWGKTPRLSLRTILENDEQVRDKCLGVIVNKVDAGRQKMYENQYGEGYLLSACSQYYR